MGKQYNQLLGIERLTGRRDARAWRRHRVAAKLRHIRSARPSRMGEWS